MPVGLQRLALESLSAGLLVCDRHGAIAYANPRGAFTLGWDPEALGGRHIESVVGEAGAQALHLDAVLAGEVQDSREGVWQRADCMALTIGFSAAPLREPGGKITGAVILFREISEVERLRGNMARAETLASVGILASGVAHQIRNPLAGIRSSVQGFLRRLASGSKERDRLQRVLAEIDRINGLLKSLLDFARPKSPAFEISEIGPVLQEVLYLLGPALETAGVTVDQRVDVAGAHLRLDRQRLGEALMNIFLNAMQAMPQGGRIGVQAWRDRAGGDVPGWVVIQISDTGPGIPPERTERIFQPFYTTRPGGTGLGLAVVRQVMEEHGGSVAACSTPGNGAAFIVRLPEHGPGPGPAPTG